MILNPEILRKQNQLDLMISETQQEEKGWHSGEIEFEAWVA